MFHKNDDDLPIRLTAYGNASKPTPAEIPAMKIVAIGILIPCAALLVVGGNLFLEESTLGISKPIFNCVEFN